MRSIHLFVASWVCVQVAPGNAFNIPGFDAIFKPKAPTIAASNAKELTGEKKELLKAISYTGNGKNADLATQARVLSIVRRIETAAEPSPNLLSDPEKAKALDGVWFLQYTAPSEIESDDVAEPSSTENDWEAIAASEGSSNINTRKFNKKGSVSAGGIPVDTSNKAVKQIFDIERSTVTNEVMTGVGLVTVGGAFRQSENVPLRALIAFDTAKIALDVGFTIDLSFLFDIRAAISGSADSGWLETTYLSEDVRIGRGNKGSLFVLTRVADAVES